MAYGTYSLGTSLWVGDSFNGGLIELPGRLIPFTIPYTNPGDIPGSNAATNYFNLCAGSPDIMRVLAGKVVRGYRVRWEVTGGWKHRPDSPSDHNYDPRTEGMLRNGDIPVYALGGGILRGLDYVHSMLSSREATSTRIVNEPTRSYPFGRVPAFPGLDSGSEPLMKLISKWFGASVGVMSISPRILPSHTSNNSVDDYMGEHQETWKYIWSFPRITTDVQLDLSDPPRRTHADYVEIQGTDQSLPIKLAYPGSEPVVGVPITLRASNSCVSVNGQSTGTLFASEAISVTDDTGVAWFRVRGVKVGSSSLALVLQDEWEAFSDLYQPAFGTAPISVDVQEPWVEPPEESEDPAQSGPSLVSISPLPTTQVNPYQTCVFYPEQKAVEERSAYVIYEDSAGWNAGANSVDQLDGDVELVFTQPPATGVVIGFTQNRDDPAGRDRITHGFYFHRNLAGRPVAQVIESGVTKSDELPHTSGIEWRIQRASGVVRYLADGEVVCQSLVPSDGVLSVGCALYANTDAVES